MREVKDPVLWREANLDARVGVAPEIYERIRACAEAHPDDLLSELGVRIKGGHDGKRYRYFGKLVKFGGTPLRWKTGNRAATRVLDEVVVLSTTDKETVWFGTIAEYHVMWCVD